jgi:hypothetical protein
MKKRSWGATKWAVAVGMLGAAVQTLRAAGLLGSKRIIGAPLWRIVVGEVLTCLLVGRLVDGARPWIRSRLQAAVLGALVVCPAFVLAYFTVFAEERLTGSQIIKLAALAAILVGIPGGLILWDPPEEDGGSW